MVLVYCPYCGNKSGRTDDRGMCISCGGNLERDYPYPQIDRSRPYIGITGGYGMITGSYHYLQTEDGERIEITKDVFPCVK